MLENAPRPIGALSTKLPFWNSTPRRSPARITEGQRAIMDRMEDVNRSDGSESEALMRFMCFRISARWRMTVVHRPKMVTSGDWAPIKKGR
jgi:hypothetical protein